MDYVFVVEPAQGELPRQNYMQLSSQLKTISDKVRGMTISYAANAVVVFVHCSGPLEQGEVESARGIVGSAFANSAI